MEIMIRKLRYFNVTVFDQPGGAYKLLNEFAKKDKNLLAFTIVPLDHGHSYVTIFPQDSDKMQEFLTQSSLKPMKGQCAFLIQGDDKLGALIEIQEKLSKAKVNITAASAVSDGKGAFGYVLYVNEKEYECGAAVLGV